MVIEVRADKFRELMTITSILRQRELKLGEKLTTQGQQHWIDPEKTKIDGT